MRNNNRCSVTQELEKEESENEAIECNKSKRVAKVCEVKQNMIPINDANYAMIEDLEESLVEQGHNESNNQEDVESIHSNKCIDAKEELRLFSKELERKKVILTINQ